MRISDWSSDVCSSDLGTGLMLPALIGFIAFFATSQGAVIWVYISEIFPTPVRARGSALGASTHWLMNALIAGVFPVLVAWSPGAPFVIFAAAKIGRASCRERVCQYV